MSEALRGARKAPEEGAEDILEAREPETTTDDRPENGGRVGDVAGFLGLMVCVEAFVRVFSGGPVTGPDVLGRLRFRRTTLGVYIDYRPCQHP